ncbi:MAG: hypothetical protein ACXWMQ_16045 [Gemmatimonadaceae bacterium]
MRLDNLVKSMLQNPLDIAMAVPKLGEHAIEFGLQISPAHGQNALKYARDPRPPMNGFAAVFRRDEWT